METENSVCIIRSMSELFKRPLKEAGSKAIEDVLKKAICELTGEDYEVDVSSIDFNPEAQSFLHDSVTLTLKMSKVFKGFGTNDEKAASATSS